MGQMQLPTSGFGEKEKGDGDDGGSTRSGWSGETLKGGEGKGKGKREGGLVERLRRKMGGQGGGGGKEGGKEGRE